MPTQSRRTETLTAYRVYLPPSQVRDLRRRAAELTLEDGRDRDWVAVARDMIRDGLAAVTARGPSHV